MAAATRRRGQIVGAALDSGDLIARHEHAAWQRAMRRGHTVEMAPGASLDAAQAMTPAARRLFRSGTDLGLLEATACPFPAPLTPAVSVEETRRHLLAQEAGGRQEDAVVQHARRALAVERSREGPELADEYDGIVARRV